MGWQPLHRLRAVNLLQRFLLGSLREAPFLVPVAAYTNHGNIGEAVARTVSPIWTEATARYDIFPDSCQRSLKEELTNKLYRSTRRRVRVVIRGGRSHY